MKEEQKKIELLQKIAHRLNEAHVQWALGASMLLYFKRITPVFHDIDLLVSEHDAECVRTILLEMGELCPPDPMPNPMYRTKAFMEFLIDSIEVDVMAGFAIVHEGTVMIAPCVKNRSWRKCRLGQKSSRCNRRGYGANTIG